MALTLLEVVSSAGQREDADADALESVWSSRLEPSVAQTSDFAFRKAEKRVVKGVEVDYLEDLIVRKDEGWEVSFPNVLEEEKLLKKLKKKLEHNYVGTFSTSDFIAMVRPALERVLGLESQSRGRDENGAVDGEDRNREEGVDEESLFLRLMRRGGALVGRRLLSEIINCSLGFQFWNALKVLLQCGLVSSVSHPDLVQKLVERRKADLLCTCFHYVLDLTPSDILLALKFLLDQSNASSFEIVRQEWRRVASSAIDAAARRKELFLKREEYIEKELIERQRAKIAKRRAKMERAYENDPFTAPVVPVEDVVLPVNVQMHDRERRIREEMVNNSSDHVSRAVVLAMAVDGFQGWETCLHALVASAQDEAVLAAIIAELETSEAVQLLQYLRKWLDRYSNRLSRIPSPPGKPGRPLHNVPSSHQVLQWVNMILDGQYTKCVLSSEFLPELRAIKKSVGSVVAIGRRVAPLIGTIEHLRDSHPLPARRQDSAAHSDYTIEYLDIS